MGFKKIRYPVTPSCLWLTLACLLSVAADKAPAKFYFSGWLAEVHPQARTFTVRSKNKLLQFTVERHRTNITVDGSLAQNDIKWARVGDAVMGKVSLRERRPLLAWVEFTHKPAVARHIRGRPGFVVSPYDSTAVFDARKYASGDMVLDERSDRIFLLP